MNPHSLNQAFNRRRGFTLTELLVVIGVVGILAALLLPALARGKFTAKVANCTANYKQLCIASTAYSSDDPHGRLPSFELPVQSSQLTNYNSLEPWFLALEMIPGMTPYGVSPQMWFCPTRKDWDRVNRLFQAYNGGRSISTAKDLNSVFVDISKASIAGVDLCWWVPRQLEKSKLTFPDPTLIRCRIPDPWPSKADGITGSLKPIISDRLVGMWDDNLKTVSALNGGHSFGGSIKSCNVAFADGHVETRPFALVTWQVISPGNYAIMY